MLRQLRSGLGNREMHKVLLISVDGWKEEVALCSVSLRACVDFFDKRPWWKQTWIIQEVCNSSLVITVCIGKLYLLLGTLFTMWLSHESALGPKVNEDLIVADAFSYAIQQSRSFTWLVRPLHNPILIINRERASFRMGTEEAHSLSTLTRIFRG